MGAILGADVRRHPLALFSLLLLFLEKWATLICSDWSLVEWLASYANIVAEIGWISQRKRLLFTYLSFLIQHWWWDTLTTLTIYIYVTTRVDAQLWELDLPICHILQLNGCFAISFDIDTSSILHFPRKARVISDRTIFNEDLNRWVIVHRLTELCVCLLRGGFSFLCLQPALCWTDVAHIAGKSTGLAINEIICCWSVEFVSSNCFLFLFLWRFLLLLGPPCAFCYLLVIKAGLHGNIASQRELALLRLLLWSTQCFTHSL